MLTTGVLDTVLAPRPQLAAAQPDPAQPGTALLAHGQRLYNNACISCHGANLQGVPGSGPSLIGLGEAAVYFQVSTGRMPLAREQDEGVRKPPLVEFDPATA